MFAILIIVVSSDPIEKGLQGYSIGWVPLEEANRGYERATIAGAPVLGGDYKTKLQGHCRDEIASDIITHSELVQGLVARSSQQNNPSYRALASEILSGSAPYTGYFLRWVPSHPNFCIKDGTFLQIMRKRLMVPARYPPNGIRCACRRGGQVSLAQDPFHAAYCAKRGWERIARHDDIKLLLANSLRTLPDVTGVRLEPHMPNASCRGDILITWRGSMKVVDVSVTCPSRETLVRSGTIRAGTASEQREKEKFRKYTQPPNGITETAFVPFVVETGGRIGKKGTAFLRKFERAYEGDPDPARRGSTTGLVQKVSIRIANMVAIRYARNVARWLRQSEEAQSARALLASTYGREDHHLQP